MSKTVAFHTLGCKLNFSETSTIARQFESAGYKKVDPKQPADIYVINTCSVTNNADKECKTLVKQSLKLAPNAFIVVIGCYAQLKPKEIVMIPGVDLVLGTAEKFNILDYIRQGIDKKEHAEVRYSDVKFSRLFFPSFSKNDRTRSFLKIQDGCDYFCSFCTIPMARGRSRNASIAQIVEQANEIAQNGIKEIVLTGVNIGDFGRSTNETFFDLIKQLDKVEGIKRYRISSIEPNLITEDIIKFVANSEKFLPHFHIPLQSGSDKILKLMRRRYDTTLYQNKIDQIKTLIPHACIGADVIVGFPSETDEDFLTTYHFINQLDISYLHVFTYSERDNTNALRITDVVDKTKRQERNTMLRSLSDKKKRYFYEQNLGKTFEVLFEQDAKNGRMFGFTSNYIKVNLPDNKELYNTIQTVQLKKIEPDTDSVQANLLALPLEQNFKIPV